MGDLLHRALRLPRLLSVVKVQLLLLITTTVALAWLHYARHEAVQQAMRLNQILFIELSHEEGWERPTWDLFRMNPDGSKRTRLTHDGILEIDPVWSPDGRQIAFAAVTEPRDLCSDIYVMNADGTRRRRLTRLGDDIVAACPTWSPDGRRIAFASSRWGFGVSDGSDRQLYVIDATGKNLRRMGRGMAPSWSPDGRWILYTDTAREGRFSPLCLYLTDPKGRARKRLADQVEMGIWSPDGKRIAYVEDQEEESLLFVIDADGSEPQLLVKSDQWRDLHGLRWTADGRRIMFTLVDHGPFYAPDGAEICAVDVSSKQVSKLKPDRDWRRLEGTGGGAFGSYLVCLVSPFFIMNTPMDQALLDAIQEKQTARVKSLLQEGADPNARSPLGGIPASLWAVAHTDDPQLVRDLIQHGADVNARTLEGTTILQWAAARGDLTFVRFLLSQGAGASTRDLSQALVATAESELPLVEKRIQVAKFLLDRGADVNARSPRGTTALMGPMKDIRTVSDADSRMVKFLLDCGADVNLQSDDGFTALMYAANSGDAEAVKVLLVHGANAKLKNTKGQTALQVAAEHMGLLKGLSALEGAVEQEYLSCIRLLIEAGAID